MGGGGGGGESLLDIQCILMLNKADVNIYVLRIVKTLVSVRRITNNGGSQIIFRPLIDWPSFAHPLNRN